VQSSDVRVAVYEAPAGLVTLSFPSGGELRSSPGATQAPGFPVAIPPGGTAVITYDGAHHVPSAASTQPRLNPASFDPSSTTTTPQPQPTPPEPPPPTTHPPPPPPPAPPPAPEAPPAPSPPPVEPPPPTVPTSPTPIWASGSAGAPTSVPER